MSDLEKKAIERLKMASEMSLRYYGQPLVVTISGGKDSDVTLELARRSGIPFDVQHSHTTADAPQTVQHVREEFRVLELLGVRCTLDKPKMSMWQLIPHKTIPPTRLIRYCCTSLKEAHLHGRMITTGVRWSESRNRKSRGINEALHSNKDKRIILANDNDDKRLLIERCEIQAKTVCNPIIDWKDSDVWDYIKSEHIIVNPLYDCGFKRVGCIGCPMAGKRRYHEFRVFPKYEQMYMKAFDRMLQVRRERGLGIRDSWRDAEAVFRWWMEEDVNLL